MRDQILGELFEQALGPEAEFARELYVNPEEVREMQGEGMVMAGHSHTHSPLSALGNQQDEELRECAQWLHANCATQSSWPLVYPFGQPNSFDEQTISTAKANGFDCAFTTVEGPNRVGQDLFRIHRMDTNEVSKYL